VRLPSKELTSAKLQELIRRNDVYRQGKIDLPCFSRLINAANRANRDWLVETKNKVSSALARNFSSLEQAFSVISRN